MPETAAFGFLGGDRRQLFAARAAQNAGREVYLCGFETADTELPALPIEKICERCGTIILPLPVTRDGKTLNAPLAQREILCDDTLAKACAHKRLFGGMTARLRECSPLWEQVIVRDYYAREELTAGNAYLTAEAALAMMITETSGTLCGASCLVTGFGRIGKALCKMLTGLGARVDCCARKPADLISIRCLGYGAVSYPELSGGYEYVFNTVPAVVLGERELSRFAPDTVLMELASAPGGIDLTAAARHNLRVISAPSLPGKVSPRATGELVWQTIQSMMEESE